MRRGREKPNYAALGRAIRYLGRYRSLAARAYLFLLLSTGAMLLVPQVVQQVIDGIIGGLIAAGQRQPGAIEAAEQGLYFAAILIALIAVARGLFAFEIGRASCRERV